MSTTSRSTPTLWAGPVAFAALMIAAAGLFNVIGGLGAIFSDEVYVTAPQSVLFLDVTVWGWVHLIVGAGLLVTGVGVLLGQSWARSVTVGLVLLNLVTQLVLSPAYPLWALLTIAIDVLVIYAVTMHGDEVEN